MTATDPFRALTFLGELTSKMPITVDEFLEFAESVAANSSDRDAWQQYAATHYADERLETARREIVRICIADDPNGIAAGQLTERASKEVFEVAAKSRHTIED